MNYIVCLNVLYICTIWRYIQNKEGPVCKSAALPTEGFLRVQTVASFERLLKFVYFYKKKSLIC